MEQLIKDESMKSRSHSVIAGFIDYFYVSIFIMIILSVLTLLNEEPLPFITSGGFLLGLPLVVLLCVVLYHTTFAKKYYKLSIGERLAGKEFVDNEKTWQNQYNKNRIGIYAIILFNVILLGNLWDDIGAGYVYAFSEIAGKCVRILIVTYSLLFIIKGELKGLWILIFVEVFSLLITSVVYAGSPLGVLLLCMNGTLCILYLVAFFVYKKPGQGKTVGTQKS